MGKVAQELLGWVVAGTLNLSVAVTNKPRVVLFCCDGPYQHYLARRLYEAYELTGIVVRRETRPKGALGDRLQRYLNPAKLYRYLVARWDMARAASAAAPMLHKLFGKEGTPSSLPLKVDTLVVENINDHKTIAFVQNYHPDIVCVNGTNLLREPLLALIPNIPFGIINLHTGLSPYTRGGNCNLYALLEGHPEWVGATIHHIDPGIDSGDLILTSQVPMGHSDNYDIIDAKTFQLGINLMVVAIRQLMEGRAARVPQWQEGKLYLRRTGYVYDPFQRYQVNRMLARGLVHDYLAEKSMRDAGIRLVGEAA